MAARRRRIAAWSSAPRARLLVRVASFGTTLTAWELLGRSGWWPQLPSLSATLTALVEMAGSGELTRAMWASNQVMIVGFLVSLAAGIPLGLLVGWVGGGFSRAVDVYLDLGLTIPAAAIIPLIVMATGLGFVSRMLVVILFVIPIVVVNARTGVRVIQGDVLDMSRIFDLHGRKFWLRVLVPGSLTGVLAGVRLGLSRALTGMVLAELLLVNVGIGRVILERQSRFQSAHVTAVTLAVVLEAVVLLSGMRKVENALLRWFPETGT